MNYLTLLKNSKTIYSLLTSQDYASMLGLVGLEAAQNAIDDFKKVNKESEKIKLLHSAINHFEFADVALAKSQKSFSNTYIRVHNFDIIKTIRVFIWCNIALHEKYLKNEERMMLAIEKAEKIYTQEPDTIDGYEESAFLLLGVANMIINPMNWIDLYRSEDINNKYEIPLGDFKMELKQKKVN